MKQTFTKSFNHNNFYMRTNVPMVVFWCIVTSCALVDGHQHIGETLVPTYMVPLPRRPPWTSQLHLKKTLTYKILKECIWKCFLQISNAESPQHNKQHIFFRSCLHPLKKNPIVLQNMLQMRPIYNSAGMNMEVLATESIVCEARE
jgi:hypothetical protein